METILQNGKYEGEKDIDNREGGTCEASASLEKYENYESEEGITETPVNLKHCESNEGEGEKAETSTSFDESDIDEKPTRAPNLKTKWSDFITNPRRTITNLTVGASAGALVGYGIAAVLISAIGLSSMGPVAGGWFAANMGSGLVAGSGMSILQASAMTGSALTAGATVGGSVGAAAGIVFTPKGSISPVDPNATTPPVDPNATTPPVDPNATTPPVDPNATTPPVDPDAAIPPFGPNLPSYLSQ